MARRSNAASVDAAAAECHRICGVGHQPAFLTNFRRHSRKLVRDAG